MGVTQQRRKPTRVRPSIEDALVQIKLHKGFLTPAAAGLGMSRGNLDRMISRSSRLAYACKEAREGLLDYTESKLFRRIEAEDTRAIIFALSTIGRARGYALARGSTLAMGDTTNVVIQKVIVQPIESGKFVDGDDELLTIEGVTERP